VADGPPSRPAPGPSMVRPWLMDNSPFSRMVPRTPVASMVLGRVLSILKPGIFENTTQAIKFVILIESLEGEFKCQINSEIRTTS
jgi:hypothetical protein